MSLISAKFSLAPTLVVNSGHGLCTSYWLFNKFVGVSKMPKNGNTRKP